MYAGATVGAVVPDHAVDLADGRVQGFLRALSHRPGDRQEATTASIQAEDELAAIGMVLGAQWNGARAFTPTSGPGISLMNEFLGLRLLRRAPGGVFDVQRVGPSTGMPTRTQQCDMLSARVRVARRHEARAAVPERTREECFYWRSQAFDLAERLQTPVIVMSDLDIGMNDWMCPDLEWDDSYRPDRGKVLSAEQIEATDEVPPLSRHRRRRHPVPHAARRASEGRVFHARLGPQPVRRATPRTRPSTRQVVDRLARKFGAPRRSSCRRRSSTRGRDQRRRA